MKKIILLYVFFQLIYSVTNAQIKLLDFISPANGATNPTHIDSLGKGGYMVVPSISNRNAIPITRRKYGMLVYVQAVDSLYKLNSVNLDDLNWVALGLYSAEKVKADAAAANGSLADTARVLRAKILTDSTNITTATQTALDLKANLASPTLTGIPTAPTPADGTSTTQIATTAFVKSSITASSNSIGGVSSSTIASIAQDIAAATPNNTPNTLVKRDGSGNFSAGIITANLAGNASTTTQLATTRSIYGNSFNGGADLAQAIAGTYGGTGVDNGTKTITLGGNISTANSFTTVGNFNTTLTSTGATNITLPTTGTIATLAGTETLTNKTITSPTISSPSLTGSPTAPTPVANANSTEVATAAFVKSQISSAATPATLTAKGIIMLANDLGGTADLPTVNSVGGVSSATVGTINTTINAATSNNTPNTLVKRDGSGNFSAGNVTASLTGNVTGNVVGNVTGNLAGNASTTTQLATARSIYGNSFNGGADLAQAIAGTYGGTGVDNGTKTITLGGNISTANSFTTVGNFNTTLTSTGATNITLPTTGTVATLTGSETFTNKTIVSPTISSPSLTGSPTAPTPAVNANSTEVATAAFVKSQISSAATDATTTAKGILQLANDLGGTAALPTVNSVGGVSSATVGTINTTINAATSTNTASTLVKRDASGNFIAGNVTASLTGNVTGNLTGNVVGNVTGNLAGNASTTTQLATPRTIYGNSFDGTANLAQAIAGTYGGTGVDNGNKTITLGGNITTASAFITAGNFSTTLTSTGATNITLPTTGTIATLAGTETLTNKTLVSANLTGSPTASTPSDAATNTEVATASFVLSKITASSNSIGGVSSSTIASIASDIAAATSSNTANTLVKRDGSGNFYAGTVIANLSGNASTATKLAATKTIYGNAFDGSVDLGQAIAGTYGGTGVDNGSKTITLGGNVLTASDFTTSGNFSTTLVSTAPTNITLPTTGTIATLAGTETLTNKTIVSPTISSPSLTGSPTAPTPVANANGTEVATAAFVKAQISSAATDATNTAKGIIKLANDLGGTADLPTVNIVGGVSSSTIANINTTINAATSTNTVSTLVKRDASGNFNAGIVKASLIGSVTGDVTGNLTGNASTATKLAATKNIYGNPFDGSADLGQAIGGTYGGTGIDNGNKTIRLGGNILTASDFTTSGNFSTTLVSTGPTNITLPTTGTIATLSGTETLTSKTIVSPSILTPTISSPSLTGTPTAPTPASEANNTQVATTAFVKAQISSSATGATATERGIIKLTNDLGGTADLPTVNSVGGVNSSTIGSINTTINAATSSNTVNTLVKRDASGNFSAGTVTAALTGNVTGNVVGNLTGNVVGNLTGNVLGNVTGNLAGNASTTTQLQTPRTIYGNSFDGTTNLAQAIGGAYGGTGIDNGSKTITLGGNILTASDFTTSGNFSTTLVSTGPTNITLPTTGTIATLAGTETLTNKTIISPDILTPTISSPSLTGTPTAPTPASDANSTQVATTAFVRSQISSSATGATSTEKGIILLAGDLGGTADVPRVNTVGGVSSSTITTIASTTASATSTNSANTLVKRDGSGNFSAGTITASLAGNASTTTQLATARTIYGNSFDGTADLGQAIAGTYGGTGVSNVGKTITLGGNITTANNFTTAGNYSTTLTSIGATNVTLPTTGTIATLAGNETLTNKTIENVTLTGVPNAPTALNSSNDSQIATTKFVNNLLTSSSISGDKIVGVIPVINGGTGQSTYTDGQVLIGTTSGTLSKTTLTAGSGVTITNGNGSITVSATGSGGTVTSVNPITVNASGSSFTSTVANANSVPAISLTIPLASVSGTNAGLLSNTDYDIFNAKQVALTAGSGISLVAGTISATGLTTSNLSSSAGITNGQLAYSKTTLGSTDLILGGTVNSVTGLTALAATNITGALTGDVTGNLTGNVTGNLAGNASTTTQLATARTIYGNSFDGTANLAQVIGGTYGGTGVDNGNKTIRLGGNILTASDFTTAGNFSTTLTSTGATNITLPTTGTIATLAGTETLTNKTIVNATLTGNPTATTPADVANSTQIATAAFVLSRIAAASNTVGGVSSATIGTVADVVNAATSSNTANTLVKRDGSGNFSAGNITASLTGDVVGNVTGNVTGNLAGNASTTSQLATARTIYGNSFDGPADLGQAIGGTYGGTGINNGSKTITLGGNILTASDFATAGNYSTTLTSTGATNITLPTTGTIATLAGTETLTNKTILSPTISSPSLTGTPTAPTAASDANSTQVATTAFVVSKITSSSNSIGGVSSSTITTIAADIAAATSSNTANTLVKRDGSGNFSAGIITASLAGNASTTTQLATARNIYGNSFNGGADLTQAITGAYGGTGVDNGSNTITLGGNILTASDFTTSGSFSTTLVSTGVTNITLPTTGTIATLAGTETLTNKTISSPTISSPSLTGTPTAPTAVTSDKSTQIATTAYVNNLFATTSINSSQISGTIATDIAAATSSNTANTLVKRDGSGNFSAGTITASLAGNASTSTQLATARSIYGNNFDGSAPLTSAILGTYGGTGVNNGTKTISLGGNISTTADFITAGNYSTTLTSTGATNITLPTTGTIATLAGTETLTNKTIVDASLTGVPTAPTAALTIKNSQIATTEYVNNLFATTSVNSSQISGTIATDIAAATSSNTANTLVKRDGSGNFSAGTITASLAGNASTTTQLATARNIYGNSFNGGADLTQAIAGQFGGTGINNSGKTITLGGNITTASDFITSGNYSTTLVSTDVTNITLPTSGTIATLAGTESLTNKTIVTPTITSPSLTGTPTSTTADVNANSTQVATTAFVRSRISIDTSYLFQKTDLGAITTSIATSLSSSKTYLKIVDTAKWMNDRFEKDTAALSRRIDAINTNLTSSQITLGATSMALGGTFTSVTGLSSLTSTNLVGTLSGTASTANKLTSSKNINGVAFDGSADITVAAAAGTLTGTTLASNITASSLTSVGTITSGIWSGTAIAVANGGTGLTVTPSNGQIDIGNGTGFTRAALTPSSGISITNGSGSITIAASGITSANLSSTAGITNAQLANSKTTLGLTDLILGGTVTSVTGLSSLTSTNLIGALTGNASTATKLAATKNINGVAFDGSADITVAAAANTLTGTTLASNITASSLTSVGTITSGVWSGTTIAVANGGTGLTATPTNGQLDIGNGTGFTRAALTQGSGITITNASGGITVAASGITSSNLSSTAGITNAQLANSKTTLGTTDLILGGTITTVTGLSSITSTNLIGALTGNASTATKLAATKNINGVAFDGSADITITAASNTLTGTTLASNVVSSSLTSVGTITSGVWSGTTVAVANGGTGATTLSGVLLGNGTSAISTATEGTNYSLVREMNEEFTVDATQATTSAASSGADGVVSALFTLTQVPNTKSLVKIYINGVRISTTAFRFNTNAVPGTANGSPSKYIGYIPFKNGTYKLTTGDRVQIDYYY